MSRVPICEVADNLVINVDGSLARAFRIAPLEYTASSLAGVDALSNNIAELLRRLPDGTIVQLLVDVREEAPSAVTEYIRDCDTRANAGDAPEHLLAADVGSHVQRLAFRGAEVWLFVCQPYAFQNAALVRSGTLPLAFPRWSRKRYEQAARILEQTAATVCESLVASGLGCSPASEPDLLDLVGRMLNPGRPSPELRNGIGADADGGLLGVRELSPLLTLREQLARTDFAMPEPSLVVAGETGIRVLSIRDLPDSTAPGMLANLFFGLRAPYRLCISAEKLPAERALASLKMRRSVAHGLAALSARRNIDAEVQHSELESLMQALSQSAVCLCGVQMTCAILGRDRDDLFERTELAASTFARSGGMSALVEDYGHLDAYLSQLPGAVHRFRRTKTVTDTNAAHMLVPFGAWRGSPRGRLLLRSRAGDALPFDPFADELPAYNGLVIGGSGAGKSFFMNLLLANHLAHGGAAVVVDIGGSYRRLTEIFGGTYLDVGSIDSIGWNPLPTPGELAATSEELRERKLQSLAGFLELLASDSKDGMPNSERALLAKAITSFYARAAADTHRPTLEDVQRYLLEGEGLDRGLAAKIAQRLDLWIRGPRARLFQKPIDLDMRPSIVTIDLKALEGEPDLQSIAVYVISYIIWSKLAEPAHVRRKTLIPFDECWAHLKNGPTARLVENLARTSRKYGAGLWCISQSADDFESSSIGPALLANSFNRILLRHAVGHDRVAALCGLTDHSLAAFRTLARVKGKYSEALLQTGNHAELVQIVPSPLAYWMATTDDGDKAVEQATRQKNASASPMKVLCALAKRFPTGATA